MGVSFDAQLLLLLMVLTRRISFHFYIQQKEIFYDHYIPITLTSAKSQCQLPIV
jgi:hypothetical protein